MKEILKKRLKELGYKPVYPFSWTNDFWTINEQAFHNISESEFEGMMAECHGLQEQGRIRHRRRERKDDI